MINSELQDMDIEQLEELNQSLMQQIKQVRKSQAMVVEELEKKRSEKALADDIAALQQKHCVQVQTVAPSGIQSAAQVGTPGN